MVVCFGSFPCSVILCLVRASAVYVSTMEEVLDLSELSNLNPKSSDGKVMVPIIIKMFETIQTKMMTVLDEIKGEFCTIIESQNKTISEMKREIFSLKKQVEKLQEKTEENENQERRDSLVFSGSALPLLSDTEVCSEIAANLIDQHLKIKISPSDISAAHRLNTRKSANQKDLIVKFCRRNIKTDILKRCRTAKPDNFFVNECLTPARQTISYVLRKAKREFGNVISGSTTLEGKVFVWVKPPNPQARGAKDLKVAVNTHARLVEFCEKTLKKPLTHFIDDWTH